MRPVKSSPAARLSAFTRSLTSVAVRETSEGAFGASPAENGRGGGGGGGDSGGENEGALGASPAEHGGGGGGGGDPGGDILLGSAPSKFGCDIVTLETQDMSLSDLASEYWLLGESVLDVGYRECCFRSKNFTFSKTLRFEPPGGEPPGGELPRGEPPRDEIRCRMTGGTSASSREGEFACMK